MTNRPVLLDLSMTSPTLLPDALRAAADQALALAADPINLLDDNPFIAREWSAVAIELSAAAASLERRVFSLLFAKAIDGPETRVVGRTPIRPDATAPPLLRTPSSPPANRRRRLARLLLPDSLLAPIGVCGPVRAWAMLVTVMPIAADTIRRLCQFG
jgi:hypothetical protein